MKSDGYGEERDEVWQQRRRRLNSGSSRSLKANIEERLPNAAKRRICPNLRLPLFSNKNINLLHALEFSIYHTAIARSIFHSGLTVYPCAR